MPRWTDPPREFNDGDAVHVRRLAGTWQRNTPPLPAVIVAKASQFGDCYLVQYPGGAKDVVHVDRIEDVNA